MEKKMELGSKSSTFSKVLGVLKCFSIYHSDLTFKEISAMVGVPDSTLYRYLQILEDECLLARDPDTGKYTIGMDVISLAGIALESMDIRRHAQPHMDELSLKLGANANLGTLYQGDLLHLAFSVRVQVDSQYGILGRRSPAHTTAMGKSLLALLSEREVRKMIETYGWRPSTPYSIQDFDSLFEQLSAIRAQGYATDIKESGLYGCCLGAAIKKKGGQAIAAVSISTTVEKFETEFETIRDAVLQTARKISYQFGYIE